jgi:hypothetical protein
MNGGSILACAIVGAIAGVFGTLYLQTAGEEITVQELRRKNASLERTNARLMKEAGRLEKRLKEEGVKIEDPLPTTVVWQKGYEPIAGAYDGSADLNVILGRGCLEMGNACHAWRAFFFIDNKLVGSDARDPSALPPEIVDRSDDAITLRYPVYKPGDSYCCPTRSADVTFRWDGAELKGLAPLPRRSP